MKQPACRLSVPFNRDIGMFDKEALPGRVPGFIC